MNPLKSFKAIPFILIILVICLYTATIKDQGEKDIYDVKQIMNDSIGNITKQVGEIYIYKNPHSENFTSDDLIENFIHIISYSVMKGIDSIVGYTVEFSWDYSTVEKLGLIINIIIFYILVVIFCILIKPTAIIYLLIQEYLDKKNIKRKWWITLIIAILSVLIIIGIIWLLQIML